MQPGLYRVNKPVGTTSFSVVRAFRDEAARLGLARQLPVCHAGALDPFAEGLLLILVGHACKLMDRHHSAPKHYRATVAWGRETDTGDAAGRTAFEGPASALDPSAIDAALGRFVGWTEQIPPATSNKRVDGERAYLKAHRGEAVTLPPCRVYLHAARFVNHALPGQSTLELCCAGGYYVRALARDLGRTLGCGAHLRALRRTRIGPWDCPPPGARPHHAGAELLPWLPSRALTDDESIAVEQGKDISVGEVEPPAFPLPTGFPSAGPELRALHRGRLVALLAPRDGGLAVSLALRGGL